MSKKRKIALINISHITKHESEYLVANRIINILRKNIDTESKYCISRNTGNSGKFYYTNIKSIFMDIKESIVMMEKLRDNPKCRLRKFDYQNYVDILHKVLNDRLEYGDSIPDTTDVWSDLYHAPIVRKSRNDRVKKVALKKAKQLEFLLRFSKSKVIWS